MCLSELLFTVGKHWTIFQFKLQDLRLVQFTLLIRTLRIFQVLLYTIFIKHFKLLNQFDKIVRGSTLILDNDDAISLNVMYKGNEEFATDINYVEFPDILILNFIYYFFFFFSFCFFFLFSFLSHSLLMKIRCCFGLWSCTGSISSIYFNEPTQCHFWWYD